MTNYVYLGGSHQENSIWMKEFEKVTEKLNNNNSVISLKGINPFNRNINEDNNLSIVQRDMKILQDNRLTHVILKSHQAGALLTTGTSFECIISIFLSKPVIVIGEPETNKLHSKTGTISPCWYHPFVEYFSDTIVPDIHDAIDWICKDIETPQQRKKIETILNDINREYDFAKEDINPFA